MRARLARFNRQQGSLLVLTALRAQGRARHALEYQGSGHHQGSAAARDAVKKEALRKAGIGYHEVVAGHTTPKELRALVEKLVPLCTGS